MTSILLAESISILMFALRILLLIFFILGVGFVYHLYFVFLHKQALKKQDKIGRKTESWLNQWIKKGREGKSDLPPPS